MNFYTQLEESLKEFEDGVRLLLKSPSLITALRVNLRSLDIKDLFQGIESQEGKIPLIFATRYKSYVKSCLDKFREIMPGLNGDTRHVDLYIEQMRGRVLLVNRMKHYHMED
ncbi:hypothetical protein GOV12_04175 [Candidatus Pacearchaeota archaeon]|nr:hypothetical protein [Candidatus Pacearchaeota archaeon]